MPVALKICPRCSTRFENDAEFCPVDGSRLKTVTDPLIGRMIAGRYLIQRKLGAGGMGTVYRCRHQVIDRDVAIKFLLPEYSRDKEYRHRFLTEARVANQVNHEHIIDITDFGQTDDGYVYIVMEFLQGRTVAAEINLGPMPPRRAFRIAIQIAEGLARAHELGVVHRDIKPENIYLISYKDEPDFVKILDFGVARFAQELHITKHGTVVGTPEYMSPEQITGREITHSSDLYSLGCVLFEMLTSRMPFEGSKAVRVIKQMTQPTPKPSDRIPSIPSAVDRVVSKLLNKTPRERHRDAHHLIEELRGIVDTLPDAPVPDRRPISYPPDIVSSTTVPMKVNQEQWQNRIALLRRLLEQGYPDGDAPQWLCAAIKQLQTAIEEVPPLSERLTSTVTTATWREKDERDTRLRIGKALDVLASDDSRIDRQIDEIRARLDSARCQLVDAMRAVSESVRRAPPTIQSGEHLSTDDATAINLVIQRAQTLTKIGEQITKLDADLESKQNERSDVHFQIEQLKGRLGTLNAESSINKSTIQEQTEQIESELRTKLNSIVPLAGKAISHFMQFPELRALLASHLESDHHTE
jgi:serine/threonine protein kinase